MAVRRVGMDGFWSGPSTMILFFLPIGLSEQVKNGLPNAIPAITLFHLLGLVLPYDGYNVSRNLCQ